MGAVFQTIRTTHTTHHTHTPGQKGCLGGALPSRNLEACLNSPRSKASRFRLTFIERGSLDYPPSDAMWHSGLPAERPGKIWWQSPRDAPPLPPARRRSPHGIGGRRSWCGSRRGSGPRHRARGQGPPAGGGAAPCRAARGVAPVVWGSEARGDRGGPPPDPSFHLPKFAGE